MEIVLRQQRFLSYINKRLYADCQDLSVKMRGFALRDISPYTVKPEALQADPATCLAPGAGLLCKAEP